MQIFYPQNNQRRIKSFGDIDDRVRRPRLAAFSSEFAVFLFVLLFPNLNSAA